MRPFWLYQTCKVLCNVVIPPGRRCQVEARAIHYAKGLVLRMSTLQEASQNYAITAQSDTAHAQDSYSDLRIGENEVVVVKKGQNRRNFNKKEPLTPNQEKNKLELHDGALPNDAHCPSLFETDLSFLSQKRGSGQLPRIHFLTGRTCILRMGEETFH
ncbi:hypothetical protein TNCV_3314191 [Trichonephila clavipes]|nr:hypothetical protein TNCV_3314191 [Trichonephila clavipes]